MNMNCSTCNYSGTDARYYPCIVCNGAHSKWEPKDTTWKVETDTSIDDKKHDELLRLGCINAAATRLRSDYSDDTFETEVNWYYNYCKTGEWE